MYQIMYHGPVYTKIQSMNNVLNIRHLLLKVSEVKLFGEEELTVDLYISFCEWPSDHTKVLIFGHRYDSKKKVHAVSFNIFLKIQKLWKSPENTHTCIISWTCVYIKCQVIHFNLIKKIITIFWHISKI